MRPFKFFFAVSLGILIFFFVAKFVVIAFLIALGFTLIFSLIKRVKSFAMREQWYDEGYHPEYDTPSLKHWSEWETSGDSLDLSPRREYEFLSNYRRVEIL
jgi:hypothetical protein